MNSTLMVGTFIVTCALISYSTFIITEQRHKILIPTVMVFLTLGISLDFSATVVMIIGSRNIPITPHGFLGYSALTVMLIDTILMWRHWTSKKKHQPVSQKLQSYTRFAYGWWVIAYIAGALLAIFELR